MRSNSAPEEQARANASAEDMCLQALELLKSVRLDKSMSKNKVYYNRKQAKKLLKQAADKGHVLAECVYESMQSSFRRKVNEAVLKFDLRALLACQGEDENEFRRLIQENLSDYLSVIPTYEGNKHIGLIRFLKQSGAKPRSAGDRKEQEYQPPHRDNFRESEKSLTQQLLPQPRKVEVRRSIEPLSMRDIDAAERGNPAGQARLAVYFAPPAAGGFF